MVKRFDKCELLTYILLISERESSQGKPKTETVRTDPVPRARVDSLRSCEERRELGFPFLEASDGTDKEGSCLHPLLD